MSSSICAVVVTHFPRPECAENLLSHASQVARLIVVDNGSSPDSLAPLERAAQELNVTVTRLGANLGIATALNIGLRFAREHGFQWLATFDQDSRSTPGMVERMLAALSAYPHKDRVAIVTPCHVNPRFGFALRYPTTDASGAGWRITPVAMTSGNLVDVRAASTAGGFDDSLFVDMVDCEFCLRLRKHGYRVLEATNATIVHSVGDAELRRFLSRRVITTNHSALRRYYGSRNRLILWRRYWRSETAYVLRDFHWFLRDTFYIALYERQAMSKLAMIARGLFDGLRGVRGPFKRQ